MREFRPLAAEAGETACPTMEGTPLAAVATRHHLTRSGSIVTVGFDSVVVGAGIIGSSIAWRLAQAGVRVALLDAGRMGGEASWAAAGMLAPGGEIEAPSPWASFAAENLGAYPGFISELEEETGQTIDYQRLGALEIAITEADWGRLLARAECQAKLGIHASRLSGDELRREVPLLAPSVAGALFYAGDALVDPRGIMRALRTACLNRGVDIREGVRATEIHPQRQNVQVLTDQGAFATASAVLAAGAWSSQIVARGCGLPQAFPVRGHLAGFPLEAGSIGPIVRREHTYILQRAGGFTIAGTSSERCGFDRCLDASILCDIHERAAALLPALAARPFAESWLGFRPGIEADVPSIGPVPGTSLWLAYGHYRNGILMAPLTAARVAAGIIASSEKDSSAPSGRP